MLSRWRERRVKQNSFIEYGVRMRTCTLSTCDGAAGAVDAGRRGRYIQQYTFDVADIDTAASTSTVNVFLVPGVTIMDVSRLAGLRVSC